MNVYDFDGTIYYSNCSAEFALRCINRHPKLLFTFCPKVALAIAGFYIGKVPLYHLESTILSYLGQIDDIEAEIEKFWDRHEKRISQWYLAQKQPDDLIISASPECLIGPIAKRLGVKYIATEYDPEAGVFLNNVMYAKEKARYIINHGFPVIDNFYSDSLSDTPLAMCSEKAHLVTKRGKKIIDWPEMDEKNEKKIKSKIRTGWKHLG